MQFDFSIVDWSDDSSPFDQDQEPECEPVSLSSSSSSWTTVERRTPTIRFAEEDEVFDHIHRSDYTEEDINATWFRPHEFRQIRNQVQQFVYMLEQRQGLAVEESDTMTMRGMEFRTTEGGMKRSLHKRQAYAAVLEEQERQWVSGREDPDRIAASYQTVSCKCQGMALLKGVQDEHDIRAFVRASSTPCTTTSTPTSNDTSPITTSNTTTTASDSQSSSSSSDWTSPCKPYETESLAQQIDILQELASVLGKLDAWAPPDRDLCLNDTTSSSVISTSIPRSSTDTFVWLAQPSKETETSCRRLAVLEDIKILSGASQLDLWHINANPAAA